MKTRILTILALLAAWFPARAAEPFATLLPEAPTFFISLQDSHLFENLDDHPLAKIIGQSELKKVFAPMMKTQSTERERMENIYKEDAGVTPSELRKLFNGGSAMGITFDFAKLFDAVGNKSGGAAPVSPFEYTDFIFALHFTGDDALAEKLARAYGRIMREGFEAGAKKAAANNPNDRGAADAAARALQQFGNFPDDYDASTDDYAGVTLHLWKLKQDRKAFIAGPCFALLDGTLIVSTTEAGLRAAVDRVKKGAPSLADSPRYQRFAKIAKESDASGFFDIGSVVQSVLEKTRKEGGLGGMQALMVVRALGLQQLDYLFFTLDATKNRSDMDYGITFHDKPGIMKFLTMDGPGTQPSFIPPDAESAGYGTFYFDRALAGIEAVVKEAVPMAGNLIGTQIEALKTRTGVDLRKDLIANVGPDIWDASAPQPEDGAKPKDDDDAPAATLKDSMVIGFRIKNRSAVELAVDTLINKLARDSALFEKRDYQGTTIHVVKGAPVSYVFTDDWAILSVGLPNLLERTLTRIAKGGDDHLFAMPGVKAAFDGLPDGDDGSSYLDVERTLDRLLAALKPLGKSPVGAAFKPLIDLENPPQKLNLPIVAGIRQYHDDTSLYFRAHFTGKEK